MKVSQHPAMPVNPLKPHHFLPFKRFLSTNHLKFTFKDRVNRIFDFYEEFLGIREVKKIQQSVLQVESEFAESSKQRRKAQNDIMLLQDQLKQIRQKLDNVHRSDDAYLPLITKEHTLIKSEMQLASSLKTLEENERDLFGKFSRKLRDAQEVERLRQEKTKYLSVIGSIIGACLGIIATSINYALKRKDFKEIVKMIENQYVHAHSINGVNASETSLVRTQSSSNVTQVEGEERLKQSVDVVSVETQTECEHDENKIVEHIALTESNLEYKMKIHSIATVAAIYAMVAVILPIVIKLFSD